MIVYDIETYPNVLTAVFKDGDVITVFEVSPRKDDLCEFREYLLDLQHNQTRMVGFNNLGFDYQVLHGLVEGIPGWDWYKEADRIINSSQEQRFLDTVWKPLIPQIDLFKIHHFDNRARSQSLKGCEFAMRMDDIRELPILPGQDVPIDLIDPLIDYNKYDVEATDQLLKRTLPAIEFRDALSEKYEKDFTNFSDVKCGSEVLIQAVSEHIPCYTKTHQGRKPITTTRDEIVVGDILLPYIEFKHPEFKRIHDHFKNLIVKETKGAISALCATVKDFTYHYGLGGLHGSIESKAVYSDDEHLIVDVDVASYYPNLGIVNSLYPEHLDTVFCDVYKDIYNQRKQHPKGTPENAMLKLALNGAYGNSNNPFSPLCDPQYTMTITVNGQLLLSMLCERLASISEIIQVNTDGVTARIKRNSKFLLNNVCKWWENLTGLQLEEAVYKSMFIRDVNNYLAVYENGDIKRKGAYEYEYQLHQNPSCPILALAAEAYLVRGEDVEGFIYNHTNPHDFVIRAKVTGKNKCYQGEVQQQKITRYHIAKTGEPLTKVMPPVGPLGGWKKGTKSTKPAPDAVDGPVDALGVVWDSEYHTKNKSRYEVRRSVISEGKPVQVCNRMTDFDWDNLDYSWYVGETYKLTEVFQ